MPLNGTLFAAVGEFHVHLERSRNSVVAADKFFSADRVDRSKQNWSKS